MCGNGEECIHSRDIQEVRPTGVDAKLTVEEESERQGSCRGYDLCSEVAGGASS